jgi:tRNA(Arg) A34 adenosine deaminase TadA
VDPNGRIVWQGRNRVRKEMDPTAHAEVAGLRDVCRSLGTLSLAGYAVYSTSEPCVTCFSACLKAKVSAIYYGADTESTASLPLSTRELAKHATRPIVVERGILGEECLRQRQDAFGIIEDSDK